MKEIMEILNNLDWSPLFISIKTGIVATIISFFLGIYAARKSGGGRNSDASYGAAAYGSRIFPAAVIQQKKTGGNLFV